MNQCVKENHPKGLSLIDIFKIPIKDGKIVDEIYVQLTEKYPHKYMYLTPKEEQSLLQKIEEFKSLVKKTVLLSYLLVNTNDPNNIQNALSVYMIFKQMC